MKTILIPSGHDSEKVAQTLFRMIKHSNCTMLISDSLYHFESGNPEFCIAVCHQNIEINPITPCIVLVPKTCKIPFTIPPGATVLSFAETGIGMALDGSQQLISCGLRQRDTLTLSSLDSQKPVFSVQRTINTLRGEPLEIGEYPLVITEEHNHRDIIAAAAVLLLNSGNLPPDCFCHS